MKRIALFLAIMIICFFNISPSYAEESDQAKTDPTNDVVKVKRGCNTIVIDYYYKNYKNEEVHVSRYYHFLKNHPRYKLYQGYVIFYRKKL